MTSICHLLDDSAGWEQRIALKQLFDRLPADRYRQTLIALNGGVWSSVIPAGIAVKAIPSFKSAPWMTAPLLRRALDEVDAGMIHAWGVNPAVAATACGRPVVVQLFDPHLSIRRKKQLQALRSLPRLAFACASGTVRRRLVECGMPPDRCVVIRPGVDFGQITQYRKSGVRESLGLGAGHYVVMVTEPVVHEGGQFEAAYACELASFHDPALRVVVPGVSGEVARIRRTFEGQPRPEVLITPGDRYPFEALLCGADVLIVAPFGDASSTPIAWAMAAGVSVIGVANYAIAELVAHKVNGLLFKPVAGEGRAVTLGKLLIRRELHAKGREAARGQAFQVFGIRRCVEQHARLYDNLLSGAPPEEGIVDSALSA